MGALLPCWVVSACSPSCAGAAQAAATQARQSGAAGNREHCIPNSWAHWGGCLPAVCLMLGLRRCPPPTLKRRMTRLLGRWALGRAAMAPLATVLLASIILTDDGRTGEQKRRAWFAGEVITTCKQTCWWMASRVLGGRFMGLRAPSFAAARVLTCTRHKLGPEQVVGKCPFIYISCLLAPACKQLARWGAGVLEILRAAAAAPLGVVSA